MFSFFVHLRVNFPDKVAESHFAYSTYPLPLTNFFQITSILSQTYIEKKFLFCSEFV